MNEILVEAAAGESGKIWIIRKYLVCIALKLSIHDIKVGYSKEPLHTEHALFAGLHFRLFRTSLVVWWLTLCTPMQGAQVRSLVGELGSYRPHSAA